MNRLENQLKIQAVKISTNFLYILRVVFLHVVKLTGELVKLTDKLVNLTVFSFNSTNKN